MGPESWHGIDRADVRLCSKRLPGAPDAWHFACMWREEGPHGTSFEGDEVTNHSQRIWRSACSAVLLSSPVTYRSEDASFMPMNDSWIGRRKPLGCLDYGLPPEPWGYTNTRNGTLKDMRLNGTQFFRCHPLEHRWDSCTPCTTQNRSL